VQKPYVIYKYLCLLSVIKPKICEFKRSGMGVDNFCRMYRYGQYVRMLHNKGMKKKVLFGIVAGILVILTALFLFRDKTTNIIGEEVDEPYVANYNAPILFMGDTMLARTVGDRILAGEDPYTNLSGLLNSYALRIANLETTIADPAVAVKAKGKLFTFNAPLESIDILKKNKIDIVSLANNHTVDYGPAATLDMIARLKAGGIKPAGAGNTVSEAYEPAFGTIKATNNLPPYNFKIAIIAVNDVENQYTDVTNSSAGSAYFDKEKIAASIKSARDQKADFVFVFPHWGTEYQTTANDSQRTWGRFFIDSGADMVIGGHAHVIQPTEEYKGKYIVYSMGNFIFDDMEGAASIGQMVGVTLNVDVTIKDGQHDPETIKPSLKAPQYMKTRLDSYGFPVPTEQAD